MWIGKTLSVTDGEYNTEVVLELCGYDIIAGKIDRPLPRNGDVFSLVPRDIAMNFFDEEE
jgi:hypothetical protein